MEKVFTFDDAAAHWPRFPDQADKYSRGVVGVMTGSARYPGAAVLSVLGALNSGAGFVRFCGTNAVRHALVTRTPSVTFGPGPVDAWVLGCGWDDNEEQTNTDYWNQALESSKYLVVDAGALSYAKQGCPPGSILTPHAGELARLLEISRSQVETDPAYHAVEAARQIGATVLLKGHVQYLATSTGRVTPIESGSSWLATAGSGDVLAGVVGTALAQTSDPELAGLIAAGVQAWVSTVNPGPYPPDRVAELLPAHLGRLETRII